jgi:tetratricopeptide (TPR) repeat protein
MGNTTRIRRFVAPFALAAVLSAPSASAAQNAVSVSDREKAADAYDQGTAAYLAKDYEDAAHWFERAYRFAPTSAALLQAVRAHAKSENFVRAANLALELRDEYPNDERARTVAADVIAKATDENVLVRAECESDCAIELDGALVRSTVFFVTPDVEHVVKAAFDEGETTTEVRGQAGEEVSISLAAPLPPPPPPVPRWAFYSSLGATLALGAVSIWSGVDANRGVEAYESAARTASSPGINANGSPTPAEEAQSLYEDGQRKERRTNILIGVTAGMAVTTAVLGVFTDWKGESRTARRVEPSVGVGRRGGGLTLRGTF